MHELIYGSTNDEDSDKDGLDCNRVKTVVTLT